MDSNRNQDMTESMSPLQYFAPKDDELQTVKVSYTNADEIRMTSKVPCFNGEKHIEFYCRMMLAFNTTMRDWNITTGPQLFKCFTQFVTGPARTSWDLCVQRLTVNQNSIHHFNDTMTLFLNRYCTATARDDLLAYLQSTHARKPKDLDVRNHANRLDVLFQYHDLLPGHTDMLRTNDDRSRRDCKILLFNSFPEKWRLSHHAHAAPLHDISVTTQTIIHFMEGQQALSGGAAMHRNRTNDRNNNSNRYGRDNTGRNSSRNPYDSYRPYPSQDGHNNYRGAHRGSFNSGNQYNNRGIPRGGGNRFRNNGGRTGGRISGGRHSGGRFGGRSNSSSQPPHHNSQATGQHFYDSNYINTGNDANQSSALGNDIQSSALEYFSDSNYIAEGHDAAAGGYALGYDAAAGGYAPCYDAAAGGYAQCYDANLGYAPSQDANRGYGQSHDAAAGGYGQQQQQHNNHNHQNRYHHEFDYEQSYYHGQY